MRVIVGLILAAMLFYAGYWVVAVRTVNAQIEQVLQSSKQLAAADVQVSGFPHRFDLRGRDVVLTSRDMQTRWFAPDVTVTALSYRPNHMIALVTGQQELMWRGVRTVLNAESTSASLVLTPGTALAVARSNLALDRATLQVAGSTQQVDTLRVAARTQDNNLDLAIEALTLTPDPALVAWLDPNGTLPPLVARLGLDAVLNMNAPVALRGAQPQVLGMDVRALMLDWGALTLQASGTLRTDGPGTLGGQITLRIKGWPLVLDALARNGAIAPDMVGMARQMIASMSDPASGELTLPLSVSGSRVAVGPFVLATLPRF